MNKVIMMGRLTRDPETRYSQDNMAVARFSIAVDRRYVGADGVKVDFHNCIAFGKTAEIIEKYMKKGTKVLTTGSVQNNNYTNKDGVKVYATQIKVDEIEFCESKSTGNNDVPEQGDGFLNIPDGIEEELPFS